MRTQLASPAESGISCSVWHLQLSLAFPAEPRMTIILERVCIRPTEAIRQGDKPYIQHSPLLLRSVEQEKQTNKQANKQAHKQANKRR